MGTYRTVSLSFWSDPKVDDEFTPEDKYMFLYLLTNPHTNICGCYEVSFKQISRDTGYTEETVKKIIDRLQTEHNVIEYSEDTKEVLIHNWGKYNWTDSDKLKTAVLNNMTGIKNELFRDYVKEKSGVKEKNNNTEINTVSVTDTDTDVCIGYGYPIDTLSIGYDENLPKRARNRINKELSKKSYGEFQNVKLTDEEIEKLKSRFNFADEMIEKLSAYMKSKRKSYTDHYATLLNWCREEQEKRERNTKKGSYDWSKV